MVQHFQRLVVGRASAKDEVKCKTEILSKSLEIIDKNLLLKEDRQKSTINKIFSLH